MQCVFDIAERRIARTEIVERQLHAKAQDLVEYVDRARPFAKENTLGHFKLEPLRGQSAVRERRKSPRGNEIGVVELFG